MPPTVPADSRFPTGAVTFLFTDIEGSTTLWEQYPEAMQVALARHDAQLRHAIESSSGCIVKSTGDGVHAVFSSAADALAACLAAQRSLQAPSTPDSNPATTASEAQPPIAVKVRMGLHTGAAELRDGDYFGRSLNRAARIMSAAHGGQVLLSVATAESVREQLPEGVTLREMGEHRLKGLLNPERLLQVVAVDLRADFPPLASITGHSLPAERDAFVGRREPLAGLAERIDAGARLVSVVGLGGIGKTRLVTRFGWRSLGNFPGGIWFCDLSEARSPDGIVQSVAQGLDVPLGKDDPITQLGHAIAGRGRCLIILDNFEQVARYAQETLGRWLNRAADARFLVTTREVLGLSGEEVFALAPLAPPDAVALFMHRAEAAKRGFQPNAEDQAAMASLVQLLDGLPLGIELAAARVRIMPTRMLLSRMNERFKLLTSSGGRVDRQATLRAVFDWSWDLLSVPEKAALAQLSVFEGGFTLESVEAILDLSAFENAPWPMDTIQSLVQKSQIRQVGNDRFDLLVSVQEYAAEQLRTTGRYPGSGPTARLDAQARHGRFFAGVDERSAIADGCADLSNLIAACRRAAARGDADVAVNVLERAWAGLGLRGPFRLGVELASMVRTIPQLGPGVIARVDCVAGRALESSGNGTDARVQLESSLSLARVVADKDCECHALITISRIDWSDGRMEVARAHFADAVAVARAIGNQVLESEARNGLGILENLAGRMEEARANFDIALALARETIDKTREGAVLGNLGALCFDEGNMAAAFEHFDGALAIARQVGNRRLEGDSLSNLGIVHLAKGRYSEATDPLGAALIVARELGHAALESHVLCNLGIAYDGLARFDDALDYYETGLVVARENKDRRGEGVLLNYLGLLHARQLRYDAARQCLESGETLLRAASDRIFTGIVLCSRAELEYLAGVPAAAEAALGAADIIAAEVGVGPDSELGLALTHVRNLLGRGNNQELKPR